MYDLACCWTYCLTGFTPFSELLVFVCFVHPISNLRFFSYAVAVY